MSNRFFHKNVSTKIVLYVIIVYIFAQFLWWEVLMVRLHTQLMEAKQSIAALSVSSNEQLTLQLQELEQHRNKKILMIAGEGTIFLLILLYGVTVIHKAQKKESALIVQKNNFLLSITHELKTPLTTTKLQLQTLKKHQLSPDKQAEIIDLAIQENERLNVLIDNLLLATRMQQENFNLVTEKMNVGLFIQNIITRTYRRELDKGILKVNMEENVWMAIDKIAFPSIILNLIDNSFKYSFEEIDTEIVLKKSGQSVLIEFRDKGVGIKSSEKTEIFKRFYRSGSEEIRKTKGTGLGLFIVKYLVEKHKGSVTVSDNIPKGSVFTLIFPQEE